MSNGPRNPSDQLHPRAKELAPVVAMTVRNAMEGFHVEHLSDAQMAELNPIIRNAIATALHCIETAKFDESARRFLNFQAMLVPCYWEPPKLIEDFVNSWTPPTPVPCANCGRPILPHVNMDGDITWWHHAPDGVTYDRGCRAASFSADHTWDDTLGRSLKARPRRGAR